MNQLLMQGTAAVFTETTKDWKMEAMIKAIAIVTLV